MWSLMHPSHPETSHTKTKPNHPAFAEVTPLPVEYIALQTSSLVLPLLCVMMRVGRQL
jgi:hypothetical protein